MSRAAPASLCAIDIGGTHARFAIAQIAAGRVQALGDPVTFRTGDFGTLGGAWQAFVATLDGPPPDAAAIAIAAPVGDAPIKLTNNAWVIRPDALADELGVAHVLLLNDFAAVGHAVAQAGAEHFTHLCGPDAPLPERGVISILGPGTGLGVAHVLRLGGDRANAYHVQPTEGGHIDYAPTDPFEDALLALLRKRHRRVSVERVVAGPGIVDIHATLAALDGAAIHPMDDKALWTAALDDSEPLARTAAERFCMALGSVAGDIALAQGGNAVVIAGGLGLRIRALLTASEFAARFRAKGRFERLMAALPVKLITHPQPGLFGAAAAFAREHHA